MPIAALLLPLLAQVGPGGALPQAPLPDRPTRSAASAAPAPRPQTPQLQDCLALAQSTPADALDTADAWLAAAKTMADRAGAQRCKALALTGQENWADAAPLFLAARDNTPASDPAGRARLAALAGSAWLAAGDNASALAALDHAHDDARSASDPKLDAATEIDRARALVALGRSAEAGAALADARTADPANAQAWLLSATLSRRQGQLAEAQHQIERAAELMPIDPEIGLEAGVIAVLAGRDGAARMSWKSVIAAAPNSSFARTAQGYLDQLGPERASAAK